MMMKRIGILVVSSALLVITAGAASAANETFVDCDSAYNYGKNTADFYVSAAMNQATCDAARLEKAEVVLARTLKRQKINPTNSEATKVCFYQGLYAGYVEMLAAEYADCGLGLELLPSVVRAAVSIFTAMHVLDSVDDADIDQVFDGVFTAPDASSVACADYIVDATTQDDGLGELIDSVCWND